MSSTMRRVLFVLGFCAVLLLVNIAVTMHGEAKQAYAQLCKHFPTMANMPHCVVSAKPSSYQHPLTLAQQL